MNDQDQKAKAEPSDWVEFFACRRLKNLRYSGWDETNINWQADWDRWFDKIVEFVFHLEFNGARLCAESQYVPKPKSSGDIFCLGPLLWWRQSLWCGILCLVMILENLTLEEALEKSLLLKAPEKQYWIRKNYFIPALLFFQHMNVKHLKPAPAKSSWDWE